VFRTIAGQRRETRLRRDTSEVGKLMRVGVLDLLTDTPIRGPIERLYAAYFRKQFMGLMPQVVAAWCRQLGHEVHYSTYYGADEPRSLLPDDLDVIFIATYTQATTLAYALAKLYRHDGVRTVIGGPHAKAFPQDCLRFFDLVVTDCDKELIEDIVDDQFDPGQVITTGRPLTDLPTVEERMPEIKQSAFVNGRPILMSIVPMLSSVGCPYQCDFCIDWNNDYIALPEERLEADLQFLSEHYPKLLIGFHDPNFAVRFDKTMDVLERIPVGRRPGYIMESSLSILKKDRLLRLRETNCRYVAPGIESWGDYSNKAGTGAKTGRAKFTKVLEHFQLLGQFVPGMQANFLFGADVDSGDEPVALTKEFVTRLPGVWPTVNIPTPFGATPLRDQYEREGRILSTLPFAFYYTPYLAIQLKNYDPVTYYDHLIAIHEAIVKPSMFVRRLATQTTRTIRLVHSLRGFATHAELTNLRRIRNMLATDRQFRAFHEGETDTLPAFYWNELKARLGPYAELLSIGDVTPCREAPAISIQVENKVVV